MIWECIDSDQEADHTVVHIKLLDTEARQGTDRFKNRVGAFIGGVDYTYLHCESSFQVRLEVYRLTTTKKLGSIIYSQWGSEAKIPYLVRWSRNYPPAIYGVSWTADYVGMIWIQTAHFPSAKPRIILRRCKLTLLIPYLATLDGIIFGDIMEHRNSAVQCFIFIFSSKRRRCDWCDTLLFSCISYDVFSGVVRWYYSDNNQLINSYTNGKMRKKLIFMV